MAKKIKILFDAGPLVNGNISGVGKYTQGVISELAKNYPSELELVGHYFDFLGKKSTANLPKAANIRYRRTVFVPGKIFNMLRRLGFWLPFEIFTKERGDFHLFPGFVGWPSLFNTPSAPVIHDVTYIDFPQYVSPIARNDLHKLVRPTIKRAAFVLTISESSKAGIVKEYGDLNKPILVEHIPPVGLLKISESKADAAIKELGIIGSFILFLGNIEPRKNLVGLLNAYSLLPDATRNKYGLVLAGGSGWQDDEILNKIKSLRESGSKIYQTGYVTDEQRSALYMKAAVFVLPSHYEGFGMPLLEAMTYQTPVLASDIAALKEVAEDSALYCDPNSPEDIANKLQQLLNDKNLRDGLVAKGNERLKDFSWEKVTTDLYDQIEKVVK